MQSDQLTKHGHISDLETVAFYHRIQAKWEIFSHIIQEYDNWGGFKEIWNGKLMIFICELLGCWYSPTWPFQKHQNNQFVSIGFIETNTMILRMKMAKNCTRCLLEEEFKGLGIGMMIYFDETVDLPSLNRRELDIVNFVHFTKKCLFDMGG